MRNVVSVVPYVSDVTQSTSDVAHRFGTRTSRALNLCALAGADVNLTAIFDLINKELSLPCCL